MAACLEILTNQKKRQTKVCSLFQKTLNLQSEKYHNMNESMNEHVLRYTVSDYSYLPIMCASKLPNVYSSTTYTSLQI